MVTIDSTGFWHLTQDTADLFNCLYSCTYVHYLSLHNFQVDTVFMNAHRCIPLCAITSEYFEITDRNMVVLAQCNVHYTSNR